jgi:hypothetical protein
MPLLKFPANLAESTMRPLLREDFLPFYSMSPVENAEALLRDPRGLPMFA